MRIGVFFSGSPQEGGAYQYALSLLEGLTIRNRRDSIVLFDLSSHLPYERYRDRLKASRLLAAARAVRRSLARKQVSKNGKGEKEQFHRIRKPRGVERLFLELLVRLNRTDLIIYSGINSIPFLAGLNIPYILPVHDLQHRINPQFPELSSNGIWEEMENFYQNALPQAAAILVDSEVGKEDVLNFYQVDEDRVKVLPFAPPTYLQREYPKEELELVRQRYSLPARFIFYPAQFWQHKNHRLIIEALNVLKKEHNCTIPAVFVGTKREHGEYEKIDELVHIYGLKEQVHYLGYIPNSDIGCLYKLAEALVMPTFVGPTNIPYLEAFLLGCPVIGSNIRGIREQIGDAGLLVDPTSSQDLAQAIMKIWNDPQLKQALKERGYQKMKTWNDDNFSARLNAIIDEIQKGARK